jgi:Family of unknown function (DUF5760)
MDDVYVYKVKEWITLDDQTTELKSSMNGLIEKKKELEDDILKYVVENKLEDVTVTFGGKKLKFSKTNVKQAMSIKYIKSALTKYNEEHVNDTKIDVDDLCKFLLDNLETTSKVCIKRPIR